MIGSTSLSLAVGNYSPVPFIKRSDLHSKLDGPKWAPVEGRGRLRSQSVAPSTTASRKPAPRESPALSHVNLAASGTAKKLFPSASSLSSEEDTRSFLADFLPPPELTQGVAGFVLPSVPTMVMAWVPPRILASIPTK